MESILDSIKKLLGLGVDQDNFDNDIIMHINSVLMILNDMGVGPEGGYIVESREDTWDDYLDYDKNLELIKTYIYLKVKLIFDPPLSSSTLAAMERIISECEWRLNVRAEMRNAEEV